MILRTGGGEGGSWYIFRLLSGQIKACNFLECRLTYLHVISKSSLIMLRKKSFQIRRRVTMLVDQRNQSIQQFPPIRDVNFPRIRETKGHARCDLIFREKIIRLPQQDSKPHTSFNVHAKNREESLTRRDSSFSFFLFFPSMRRESS